MKVLFVSVNVTDLWKYEYIRDYVCERLPEVSAQIICGETNPALHHPKRDVIYILDSFVNFQQQHHRATTEDIITLQASQADSVPSNLYRADERYVVGLASDRELVLQQVYLVEQAKELIRTFRPDVMFMFGGGSLSLNVFFLIGQQMGVHCYRVLNTQFANPGREGARYWFTTNNNRMPSHNPKDKFGYDAEATRRHVEVLIASIQQQLYQLDGYAKTTGRFVRTPLETKYVLLNIRRLFHVRRLRLSSDPRPRRRLRSWRNYLANQRLVTPVNKIPQPNFVFTMNVPEDAQLVLRAPHYQDLLSVVEQIANVLPYDHTLVIKEHPGHPGMLDHNRLKLLLRYRKNVVYVSADTSLFELFPKTKGVIVINSTSGFEALIHGLPVITLADVFYKDESLTYNVEKPIQLQQCLTEVLSDPKRQGRLENLIRVMTEILQETVPEPGKFETMENNNYLNIISEGIVTRLQQLSC